MKNSRFTFFQESFSTLPSEWRERVLSSFSRISLKRFLSLKSLIVLGFIIAVIPLFFGVMYAAEAMRETAALGRTMNTEVFEQTKTVRLVLQKAADVERKAKLFILLSDPDLRQPYERQSYESMRTSFKQALSQLLKLHLDNKTALLVNELGEKENLIYQQIIAAESGDNPSLPVDEAFQGLRESSAALSREFERHIDSQFRELSQYTESLEQGLLLKGLLLLLLACVFIALLLAAVAKSMRQLDAAIRRLGSGQLAEPITVDGPTDLRYLGHRLEWLRTHLTELEASKQQFVHHVALEINAPLQALGKNAALLAGLHGKGLETEIAQSLQADIEKLQTVADELLRYSRINTQPGSLSKQTVNMKELLESVIADFQTPIQAKALTLKKLLRAVEVSGDREQLRTIAEQLLANAVKYSPSEGEIRILLRDSGFQMELEIEDEGPGIDPEERTQAFEPFFRGKSAQAPDREQGPGLGLSIVREYVANHQGKVEFIDSRQDQAGARILVQIPLSDT